MTDIRSPISRARYVGAVGLVLLFITASAQLAAAKDAAYRPPRLPDGRPDLQGSWDQNNLTPLERMNGFGTLVIDATLAAKLEKLLESVAEDRSTPTEPTEFFNTRHLLPIRGELRSSLIVDPADGKLPWTAAKKDWGASARKGILGAMDGPEQRPNSERCLGNPAVQPPMLNNPGTNLHQIVQTKDAVVFISEWMGNARIIRINSVHAPAAVTSWLGDSIGWWEGDTLVVETKNFSPSDTGRVAPPNAFMISPRATVIERITRVSDKELDYAFTVDDPDYYTRVWKGESHFIRTDDPLFEYSCHEGNVSMTYILQGARVQDGQWPPAKREQ